jgi:hypothetical protein
LQSRHPEKLEIEIAIADANLTARDDDDPRNGDRNLLDQSRRPPDD